ncbi:hypothetical protein EJ04DRAFT_563278 [Polyplosphaeria fusca]|uniref:Uncharacterized protein n=1 Tax=Polyplosphaeria fusca TaxID=682080 RepID=A0A9P4QZ78_9PLEO|nr:hypothetical protein EJ04DRAFT_563278 [Polyplosphaeria fusca]
MSTASARGSSPEETVPTGIASPCSDEWLDSLFASGGEGDDHAGEVNYAPKGVTAAHNGNPIDGQVMTTLEDVTAAHGRDQFAGVSVTSTPSQGSTAGVLETTEHGTPARNGNAVVNEVNRASVTSDISDARDNHIGGTDSTSDDTAATKVSPLGRNRRTAAARKALKATPSCAKVITSKKLSPEQRDEHRDRIREKEAEYNRKLDLEEAALASKSDSDSDDFNPTPIVASRGRARKPAARSSRASTSVATKPQAKKTASKKRKDVDEEEAPVPTKAPRQTKTGGDKSIASRVFTNPKLVKMFRYSDPRPSRDIPKISAAKRRQDEEDEGDKTRAYADWHKKVLPGGEIRDEHEHKKAFVGKAQSCMGAGIPMANYPVEKNEDGDAPRRVINAAFRRPEVNARGERLYPDADYSKPKPMKRKAGELIARRMIAESHEAGGGDDSEDERPIKRTRTAGRN